MKNTIKIFGMVAIFATVLFASCKKEEKTVTPTPIDKSINPIEKLINDSCSLDSNSILNRTVTLSVAVRFKSTQNGKITHLGLRSNVGKFKVALYDMPVDDNQLLALDSLNVTNISSFAYVDIADISIVANKNYWIVYSNMNLETGSALSALSFDFNRADAVLPMTSNNFIIQAIQSTKTTDINDFSDVETLGRIFGVPAFKFIAD